MACSLPPSGSAPGTWVGTQEPGSGPIYLQGHGPSGQMQPCHVSLHLTLLLHQQLVEKRLEVTARGIPVSSGRAEVVASSRPWPGHRHLQFNRN